MGRWLYEDGIGEARAALIEAGRIVEMRIEAEQAGLRPGAIVDARLLRGGPRRGRVRLDEGGEADLDPVPPGLAEGARLRVIVTRAELAEEGRVKPARVRAIGPDSPPGSGPTLLEQLRHTGNDLLMTGPADAALDRAGWSELLEEAAEGVVARPDALLRISPTPAMTLIDVDGAGDPAALACAGARRAGEAIRRFGLNGSIGIDLPTLPGRADRQAAAAALDAVLPAPFERTAVNGFGFLHIVRRRERPSLVEHIAADRIGHAARLLLRRAERAGGHGAITLAAAPAIVARLETRTDWIDVLSRRAGAPVRLRAEPGLAISAGHAQREHA